MLFHSLPFSLCVCVYVCSAEISHGFTKWIFSKKKKMLSASCSFDTTSTSFFNINFSPPSLCTFVCVRLWV